MPDAAKMMPTTIQERLGWKITPELYEAIRRLWIKHSIAEDSRDLQGLIDTLTQDCVYEIPALDQRWEGHDGARQFYTTFLGAFPDVKITPVSSWAAGDYVVVTGTFEGTNTGDMPSMKMKKTGNKVSAHFLEIFQFDKGKVTNDWLFYNGAAFATQLMAPAKK